MSDKINEIFEAAQEGRLHVETPGDCTYITFKVPQVLTKEILDEIFHKGREAEFHASLNFKRNSDEYEMLISDRHQELLKKYNLTEEKE